MNSCLEDNIRFCHSLLHSEIFADLLLCPLDSHGKLAGLYLILVRSFVYTLICLNCHYPVSNVIPPAVLLKSFTSVCLGTKLEKKTINSVMKLCFFLASQISLDTKPIRITTLWVSDSSLIMKRSSSLPPTITEQGNKTKNKTKKKVLTSSQKKKEN